MQHAGGGEEPRNMNAPNALLRGTIMSPKPCSSGQSGRAWAKEAPGRTFLGAFFIAQCTLGEPETKKCSVRLLPFKQSSLLFAPGQMTLRMQNLKCRGLNCHSVLKWLSGEPGFRVTLPTLSNKNIGLQ